MAAKGLSVGEQVCERIRELRRAVGVSQGDLARASGVDRLCISKFERGVRVPTLVTLSRLAQGLGVPVAAMYRPTEGLPSGLEGIEMTGQSLGERLRRLRLARGLGQVELAVRAGVSQQAVSRAETMRVGDLRFGTAVALSKALGVNLNAFVDGPPLERSASEAC
jgi:transcriptional regulator with XRE-family HTH domain